MKKLLLCSSSKSKSQVPILHRNRRNYKTTSVTKLSMHKLSTAKLNQTTSIIPVSTKVISKSQPEKESLDSLGFTDEHSSNMSLMSFTSSTSSMDKLKRKPTAKLEGEKPKLIDLEFKNELERLFSNDKKPTKIATVTSAKLCQLDIGENNDKLMNIFSLLTGNLITDYSDLLVDFKEDFLDSTDDNKELCTASASFKYPLLNEATSDDNEKVLQFLIQVLVKSCRVFDVATTVNKNAVSYWRYANPVVAAFKQEGKIKLPAILSLKSHAGTQTEAESADSIIEKLTETLSKSGGISYKLKKFRLDKKDESSESNSNNCKYTYLDSDQLSDEYNEEDIYIDLYDDEDENEYTDKAEEEEEKAIVHRPLNRIRNGGQSMSRCRRHHYFNYQSSKKYHPHHSHLYFQHNNNNNKLMFHLNSRAQDETLRDAENISDIDDEIDIDQWADLPINNNNNNNNLNDKKFNESLSDKQRIASGNEFSSNLINNYQDFKQNQNLKVVFTRPGELEHEIKPPPPPHSPILRKRDRNHTSNNRLLCLSNRKKCGPRIKSSLDGSFRKRARQALSTSVSTIANNNNTKKTCHLKIISDLSKKKNSPIMSNFILVNTNKKTFERSASYWHDEKTSSSYTNHVERTHSMDSLENYEVDDEDEEANPKNLELSEIPEIKLNFEYKFEDKDLKTNLRFEDEDLIKKRTRTGLKFWKEEEEKRRQIEASTNMCSSSSLSHSIAPKPKPNHHSQPPVNAVQQSLVIAETIARVKDRINVFENKKKEELANDIKRQLALNKKVLPQPLIRVEQVETVVQTTTNVNENHEHLETTTIKRNVPVNFHTFQPRFESAGGLKKTTASRSIGNELDKTVRDPTGVRIPIVLSNNSRSSSNIANTKSELSFSVESLNNKVSDEEEEELEILIDMSHLDEGKRHAAVDERLRNIVMHMIPTTRKAYVDDIVDGVKIMLSTADLAEIRSPVDLPAKVIKFVQKRYASLLNEQYSEASCSLSEPKKEPVEASATTTTTTTELTVVKETRHEDFLKFEEDTLYIVEKKQNSESLEVDNEIRKSFELKARQETQHVAALNLNTLIDTLKYSIDAETEPATYWNDCQLHYFNVDKQPKQPVLVMFYDVKNKKNFKSNLEKQYHKSIVETHALNDKKQINLVATICIYICNQEITHSLFEMFSLIKPPTTKEEIKAISLNKIFNSFPIGKYFVKLEYKVVGESVLNKETIVDVSLLPLPIRSQLICEYEYCLGVGASNYPTFFLMAVDKDQLQQAKEKQQENLIRKRFKQFDDCLDEVTKQAVLADPLSFLRTFKKSALPSMDTHLMEQFAKQLEIDLNSFYLCERVVDAHTGPLSDLIVKLNKLDALACFDAAQLCTALFNQCVQQDNTAQYLKQSKFTLATYTDQNETKLDEKIFDSHGNKFYLIDHGKHYKCVVPITDLPISQESRMQYTDNQFIKSVENLQHNSSLIIESMHTRKNYIFSRHLMNVSPYKKYVNLINLLMNKEYKIRHVEFNQMPSVAEVVGEAGSPTDDCNLPSFSESINDVSSLRTKPCFNKAISAMKPDKMEEQIASRKKTKNITEIEFASFETDRLKMDAEEASRVQVATTELVKNQRDKIIISEIDKMFSSIRDHQGSNAKARGELGQLTCQKKRSGSWGYSSNKRHVKAKVMDLPVAEDTSTMSNQVSQEDSMEEKVFVRIDDYLNKEVSKVLERSYSVDYLNQCAGPRIRIRYIRIPGHTIKAQSLHSTGPCQQVHEEPVTSHPQLQTEYRSAPYDLRYWSILKLLDEERQQANGQVLSYFNETQPEWQMDKDLGVGKLDNQLSANELQTFMSMDDLDKEIEKVKKEQKLRLLSNSSSTFISTDSKKEVLTTPPSCNLSNEQSPMPRYIIKEKKMSKKQANCFIQPVFEKIDAELAKLEQMTKGDEAVAHMGTKTKSTGFRIIDSLFGLNKNVKTSESAKQDICINNFRCKKNDAQHRIQQFAASEASEKKTSHITIVSKLQSLIPNNLANI